MFILVEDVVFYAMGSGEYDELARVLWCSCVASVWFVVVNEVLDVIVAALKDVLTRLPTEALLMEQYSVLCLTVDEVILEVQ